MGLTIQNPVQYEKSLQLLFPKGAYWEKQFADPNSDCSLFCKAKTGQLIRFRERMSDLQNESIIATADETLDDWERVRFGVFNTEMDITQRKNILSTANAGNVNTDIIKDIGRMYGVTINEIKFPFRPAFFGHSFFGISAVASPAAFSVIFIYASLPDEAVQTDFEDQIQNRVLSNYIIYFIYGGS